jgi:PTH2 family peptidyl-tRNA hydrolase
MKIWKNRKTGNLYEVLNTDVRDATNGREEVQYVLYRGTDGKMHVRESEEFYEKFEESGFSSMYLDGVSVNKAKMVIVVRKDLNMPVGKIAAQVAHAAMGAMFNKGEWIDCDKFLLSRLSEVDIAWLSHKFTKITLACDSLDEMNALEAKANAEGMNVRMIIDAGDTVFRGVPTPTCLAIGPDWPERIDAVTGHLRPLR